MINEKKHLFFSYKSETVKLIRRITERLKAENISVWLDEYGIRHNQQEQFQPVIDEAIDRSSWGVLFVTKLYTKSRYCLHEAERLKIRLPLKKIIVLILEESKEFEAMFPELYSGSHFVGHNESNIYRALRERNSILGKIEPIDPDLSEEKHFWQVKEAGFEFENFKWVVVPGSRFHLASMNRQQMLSYSGQFRTDFHQFSRAINHRQVSLFLDYDVYDESDAEYIKQKILMGELEAVRKKEFEEDDRKRLKEEWMHFEDEVFDAYKRITLITDIYKMMEMEYTQQEQNPIMPEIEEIGVHLFSTKDRGAEFKHRLFSFRIPSMGAIYRVYKLVLPHPQFDLPFRARFIFSFEDSMANFFKTIPWCDKLVNSFRWTSEKATWEHEIDNSLIRNARKFYKGKV